MNTTKKALLVGAALVGGIGIYTVAVPDNPIYNTVTGSVANVIDDQIQDFFSKNIGVKHNVDIIEQSTMASRMDWTINEKISDNKVLGTLHIFLNENQENLDINIPFESVIVKGKNEFDGENYGYGRIETTFSLPEAFPDELKDKFKNLHKLTTFIALDGDAIHSFNIKPEGIFKGFDFNIKQSFINQDISNINFDFKGLKDKLGELYPIQMNIDIKDNYNNSYGFISPIQLISKKLHIDIAKITFTNNLQDEPLLKSPMKLANKIGDAELKTDRIKFTIEDKDVAVDLRDFKLFVKTAKNSENKFDNEFVLDTKIEALKSGYKDLKKLPDGIAINGLKFGFNIDNISPDFINYMVGDFNKTFKKYPYIFEQPWLYSEEDVKKVFNEFKTRLFDDFVDNKGKLAFSFGNDTNYGMITLDVSAQFKENAKDGFIPAVMTQNTPALLSMFNGQVDLVFPKKIVNAISDTPLSAGTQFAVADGDKYKVKLEVKDGKVLVNGKPLF